MGEQHAARKLVEYALRAGSLDNIGVVVIDLRHIFSRFSTPIPSPLNPPPSTLNPQPSTLHPQPSTLNPHPSSLNPQL